MEMISNTEIRNLSKEQLKGKWGAAALTFLLYAIIVTALDYIPIPGLTVGPFGDGIYAQQEFAIPLLKMLTSGALGIGLCIYHLKIAKNSEPNISELFEGFNQFLQSIVAYILISIVVIVGFIFFIVPGVIAGLALSQTFYIMAENPGISAVDAMKQSWEMTEGHKMQLFTLGLSFIPWIILSILTLFIGLLWLIPYMYVCYSNFYLRLNGEEIDFGLEDHLVE